MQVVYINNHVYHLDCFDEAENKVIEFLGCYVSHLLLFSNNIKHTQFHACPDCYPSGALLAGGEPARNILSRTLYRINQLKQVFDNIEIVWECAVSKRLRKDKEMRQFFDSTEVMHAQARLITTVYTQVVSRLAPRDALYGGR